MLILQCNLSQISISFPYPFIIMIGLDSISFSYLYLFYSGHGRPDVRSSEGGEDEGQGSRPPRSRSGHARSLSVQSRSATRGPRATSVAPSQVKEVVKARKQQDRKIFKYARAGDADREHYPKLVKHLNSGKRSLGTSTIGR